MLVGLEYDQDRLAIVFLAQSLPEAREIDRAFRIESVEPTYQAGGADEAKAVTEVIVSVR